MTAPVLRPDPAAWVGRRVELREPRDRYWFLPAGPATVVEARPGWWSPVLVLEFDEVPGLTMPVRAQDVQVLTRTLGRQGTTAGAAFPRGHRGDQPDEEGSAGSPDGAMPQAVADGRRPQPGFSTVDHIGAGAASGIGRSSSIGIQRVGVGRTSGGTERPGSAFSGGEDDRRRVPTT